MQWIRKGRWKVYGQYAELDPDAGADAVEGGEQEMRQAFQEARTELAVANFGSDVGQWREVVGDTLGLEAYQLLPRDVRTILAEFSRHIEEHPYPQGYSEDQFDTGETADLVRLLTRFGPTGGVRAVVGPREAPCQGLARCVFLPALRTDIEGLAVAWRTIESASFRRAPAGERQPIMKKLLAPGWEALREVINKPEWRAGEVKYRVRPATLRCFLWHGVLRLASRNPERTCLYCGDTFEDGNQRGRPRDYCGLHRGARFRQVVCKRQDLPGWLRTHSELEGGW